MVSEGWQVNETGVVRIRRGAMARSKLNFGKKRGPFLGDSAAQAIRSEQQSRRQRNAIAGRGWQASSVGVDVELVGSPLRVSSSRRLHFGEENEIQRW